MYASNQVGGKQVVRLRSAHAIIHRDMTAGRPFDGIAQHVFCGPVTWDLKRNVVFGGVRIRRFAVGVGVGFSLGRVVSSSLGEELKLTLVEVESQSDLAVVAFPEFRLEAALNVDRVTFFEVLGDGLGLVAEEVGFVPDWNFGPILTGAGDFICAD